MAVKSSRGTGQVLKRRSPRLAKGRFKLIILHYHLRPGGIRRVIELAAPHLADHFGSQLSGIVLATGETADQKWDANFRRLLSGHSLEVFCDPALGYFTQDDLPTARARTRIRAALDRLLNGAKAENSVIWAHNLGIGRNLLLTDELRRICQERGITLLSHHHDWWFDNRWLRWPEMRACGFRTFRSVAETVLPAGEGIRHLAINRSDASVLERHFPRRSGWLPNLAEREAPPSQARVDAARAWLRQKLEGADVPIWILPCRMLRRKNIAEAILLTRWLRPEAFLVTTRAVSSPEEQFYFDGLSRAALKSNWSLRLGILEGDETNQPGVAELLALSEVVLLTSIQEGFGLPYLEAAAAGRPLIASRIPNIAPDLETFGFRFPQYYDELLVHPDLFDWNAEFKRQMRLFRLWRSGLPPAYQRIASRPIVVAQAQRPASVPFGRLTLTAQLEVLARPIAESWNRCAPLNPFLETWRKRAAARRLQVTPWPRTAARWLSGPAYARRFEDILQSTSVTTASSAHSMAAQEEFVREKLHSRHMFPLLWSSES